MPSREALRRVQTLTLGQLSSTMLGAAFRLEAFDKLGEASVSIAEAATLWGIPARSARVLAQFLCNMGLLQYDLGRVQNTPTIRVKQTVTENPGTAEEEVTVHEYVIASRNHTGYAQVLEEWDAHFQRVLMVVRQTRSCCACHRACALAIGAADQLDDWVDKS